MTLSLSQRIYCPAGGFHTADSGRIPLQKWAGFYHPENKWKVLFTWLKISFPYNLIICVRHYSVMSEYQEIGANKYPNIFRCPRIDQRNIRTYLESHELIKPVSKYIRIPKNWMNKNLNIFGGSWNDRINIRIYLGRGKATNMNTNSISWIFIIFEYSNMCVLTKTGQNRPNIVTNSPSCSREYTWMHNNWTNEYPNLFGGSRMDQKNI